MIFVQDVAISWKQIILLCIECVLMFNYKNTNTNAYKFVVQYISIIKSSLIINLNLSFVNKFSVK